MEQLPSGKFRVVLSLGIDPATKKRVKLTKTFGTKKEAVRWKTDRLAEHGQGKLAASRTAVADWLDRWFELTKGRVSGSTARMRQQAIDKLKPAAGCVTLAGLDALGVEAIYTAMEQAGVPAASRKLAGVILGTALRAAVKYKLIPANPASGVAGPKYQHREGRPFTVDESLRILGAVAGGRYEAWYELAIDAGMRPGEINGLHWPEVDLGRGTVRVRQTLTEVNGHAELKCPKTRHGVRTIELTPRTVASLGRHRERQRQAGRDVAAGAVFTGRRGGFVRQPHFGSQSFRPLMARLGLGGHRPYDLRHTSATLLIGEGASVRMVSERLGHSDIQMTLRHYAHCLPRAQQQAVATMDRLFGSPTAVPPAAEPPKN